MTTPPRKICVNAGADSSHQKRPATFVGPRCHTCSREKKKERKTNTREKHLAGKFGITSAEYQRVFDEQGRRCICGKWTGYNGASRPLSVDHDHETGIVRGLLCKHCNDLLGRVRDDPAYFEMMLDYLDNPPAVRVLGKRIVPDGPIIRIVS